MKRTIALLVAVSATVVLALPASAENPAGRHPCMDSTTNQDQVLVGTSEGEKLCGGNGNDTIRAKGGDDILGGNHGSDLLRGGPGDDRLWGGRGPDTFICGPGDDVVHQEFNTGADTIHASCETVRL